MFKLNKKHLFVLLISMTIISFLAGSFYIYKDSSIDKYKTEVKNNNIVLDREKINIGILGDSWVAKNKLDKGIDFVLEQNNIKAEVSSFGYPGAKSRQIYRNLINNENSLLVDDTNIVILIAGVNDSTGHIGKDFYANHVVNTIKALNDNGKFVAVLEVPEFNIENQNKSISSKVKHNLYKVLFDKNKDNVIQEYRDELSLKLKDEKDLNYKVISFDEISTDYNKSKNIYKDDYHLNDEGNKILSEHLGNEILKVINNN